MGPDKKAHDTCTAGNRKQFLENPDGREKMMGNAGRLRSCEAGRKTHHQGLFPFLLVPVLAQALLALVRGNLVTFAFATAGHICYLLFCSLPDHSGMRPEHLKYGCNTRLATSF
ncbi:MAG: hypothetical protein O3C45_05505 [Bacteroidetes bacterium]|nr:hypothetical protein [Bacteroidota bacterium]